MRTFDFSPLFRHSVGFDRMQRLLDAAYERADVSYPPYNIETDGADAYRVTVAVAGFDKKDLDITIEGDTLTIVGNSGDAETESEYLHRGIAGRSFHLRFSLADHVKVASANLENGMLVIDLEREVPEAMKPRKIEIETHPIKELASKAKKLVGIEDKKAA